jgi:hypothetical protein
MSEALSGKVAKILNSRELVINIGSNRGVTVGMFFEVLDPKGEDIVDPDSGETLGSVDRPKVKVKITRVLDKMSVASTYQSTRINVGGSGLGSLGLQGFAQELMPPKWVNKYETLKTTEKTWEDVDEKDCYVKVGDPVRQFTIQNESSAKEILAEIAPESSKSK